jgi:hypothetical protein
MSVEYTFVDKLRKLFGFGPTAATADAIHAEVVAKRVAEAAKKANDEEKAAKAAKAAVVKKAPVAKKPAVKKPVAFKEGAVDGDGDGLIQDGTAYERPAKKAPPKKK